jgi:hypothetical protein
MSNENAYTCTWTKNSDGFEIRSVEFPEIIGKGKTLFSAEEKFAFKLSDRVQQWPAAFCYKDPPPADEEFARFQSDWILVGGCNAVLRQGGELGHLFEGGACSKCGAPNGPRNREPLSFDYSSSSIEDVAYVAAGSAGIRIYSKQFIECVFRGENLSFEVRPAVRKKGRCRKDYFELIADRFVLPVVPSFCQNTWRECPGCGTPFVAGRFRVGELEYFFDNEEVLALGSDFAFLRQRLSGELMINLQKWRGVHNGEGLAGVSTHRVGLLPKSMHLGHAADYQKAKGESPAG